MSCWCNNPAANIFSSSFLTMGANLGFVYLSFCRKGLTSLTSCFKGMACWNTSSWYGLSSSYEKANTSLCSLTKFIKSFLSFSDVPFPILSIFCFYLICYPLIFHLVDFLVSRQSIEQVHLFVIRIQKSASLFLGLYSELFVDTCSYPLGEIVKNVLAFNFL